MLNTPSGESWIALVLNVVHWFNSAGSEINTNTFFSCLCLSFVVRPALQLCSLWFCINGGSGQAWHACQNSSFSWFPSSPLLGNLLEVLCSLYQQAAAGLALVACSWAVVGWHLMPCCCWLSGPGLSRGPVWCVQLLPGGIAAGWKLTRGCGCCCLVPGNGPRGEAIPVHCKLSLQRWFAT